MCFQLRTSCRGLFSPPSPPSISIAPCELMTLTSFHVTWFGFEELHEVISDQLVLLCTAVKSTRLLPFCVLLLPGFYLEADTISSVLLFAACLLLPCGPEPCLCIFIFAALGGRGRPRLTPGPPLCVHAFLLSLPFRSPSGPR